MQGLWHISWSLGYLAALLIHAGQLFKVETGQNPLVANVGDNITLTCHFFAEETNDLMVQWNFQGKNNVYLYNKGEVQLQYQDSRYHTRAWFNPSGLPDGNASLSLSNIGISDEGNYTCFVKNSQDRGEGDVEVRVVAPYVEVTVSCLGPCKSPLSPDDNVTLLCQSQGGYPRPQLKWIINGTSVPESVETITQQLDQTFSIQSQLVTQALLISLLECTLENQRAKEVLRAHYGSDGATSGAHQNLEPACFTCGYHEFSPMAHRGIIPALVLIGCLLGFFLGLSLGCK